jgi:Asp-tRNA(Asn)/Glu-tRNA(Gln) amidotransferase A subunit family amidase
MTEPFHPARRAFAAGSDTPRAYLERRLRQLEAAEPTLHAFVTLDIAGARRDADAATERYRRGQPLSPVDGMPLGIKDVIETANLPTGMGSARFAGWTQDRDAACVAALRSGGAIVLGKTVTTEFALGNAGPTTNPLDARRTPGGSSSGSAAAVARDIVPVALGTQEMGSLIRPASFCGVLGFKPSFGALHLGGVHGAAPSQAHLGVLAASLQDLVAVCARIAGGDPDFGYTAAKPARIGLIRTEAWPRMDAEARGAFKTLAERFCAREIEADFAGALEVWAAICGWELRWPIAQYRDGLGADTQRFLAMGERMTRAQYEAALAARADLRQRYAALKGEVDVLLLPSALGPAPIGLASTGSRDFNAFSSGFGVPAISLPLLEVQGLPLGVQLMGFANEDARLLSHAAYFIEHFPLKASTTSLWATPSSLL